MRPFLTILMMVLCLQLRAQTGFVLKGMIMDERKEAMPGATVFIGGTKYVTASDSAGRFSLSNLKPGDYKVIVKVVGYKPLVKAVTVNGDGQQMNLQLSPDAKYLKSVTVKPDKTWLDNVETFKQQFFGESDNAADCKLTNPGVLSFTYDKASGDLTVEADDLLVIKNQQLGYQLKYVLSHFVFNDKRGSVVYDGYPSFQELHGSRQEEAQWKANRRMAYLGSIHHFIHSIYDQNCKAEGFVIYKIMNRTPFGFPSISKQKVKLDYTPISTDSLVTVVDEHHKQLQFADALYVIYTKEKEPVSYTIGQHSLVGMYGSRRMPVGEVSIVNGFGAVLIDESGAFQPTSLLYFEGYMGWEKIGDLVPYDYDPTVD